VAVELGGGIGGIGGIVDKKGRLGEWRARQVELGRCGIARRKRELIFRYVMKQQMGLRQTGVGFGGSLAFAVAAGLLVGGCATAALYPPPTTGQVAAVESAVAVAKQNDTAHDTNAARHLLWAEQQLAQAKQRAAVQNNRGAALMLARASADADLSQVLSRKARVEADAAEAERVLEETRSADTVKPSSEEQSPAPAPSAPSAPPAPPAPKP
jgi:hypothetical protein